MSSDRSLSAEDLLRHAEFVRRLARSLIVDPHRADDVVQDALLAALRTRTSPVRPRSWLAVIVRNLVRSEARAAMRRAERERGAAAAEALPSTADVIERAALSRELVETVLTLDEPFRTTILMRYFDALPPRAIARRLGIPGATVRSQIARGLEKLRERLDRQHGGDRHMWSRALAPFAASALRSVTIGAWFMSTKARVALVATVVIAIGVWQLGWRGGARSRNDQPASLPVATHDEPPRVADATGSSAGSRASRAAVAPSVDSLPSALCYGSFVDVDGRTIAEAKFTVSRHEDNGRKLVTEREELFRDGVFAMIGLEPGQFTVAVRAAGFHEERRDVAIEAGGPPVQIALVLRRAILIPVRLATPDGTQLAQALKSDSGPGPMWSLAILATRNPVERLPLTVGPSCAKSGDGLVYGELGGMRRSDPAIEIPSGCNAVVEVESLPVFVSAAYKNVVLASQRVDQPATEVVLHVSLDELKEAQATVSLHLTDAAGGKLDIPGRMNWDWEMTLGDIAGGHAPVEQVGDEFTFREIAPGWLKLAIGIRGCERVLRWMRVDAGADLHLGTFALHREVKITGQVIDPKGYAVDASVWYVDLDAWTEPQPMHQVVWSTASTAAAGFALAGAGPHRLLLFAEPLRGGLRIFAGRETPLRGAAWSIPENELALRPVLVDARQGTPEPVVVPIARGTEVSFDLHLDRAKSWVLTVRDERELPVAAMMAAEVGMPLRLVPGRYRVEVDGEDGEHAVVPFVVAADPITVPVELDRRADRPPLTTAAPTVSASSLSAALAGIVVYGTVNTPASAPVSAATITIVDASGETHTTISRDDGSYAIAGLQGGVADVSVAPGRIGNHHQSVTVGEAEFQHLDLALAPAWHVTVRAVTTTGEPLESALRHRLGWRFSGDDLRVVATCEPPPARLASRNSLESLAEIAQGRVVDGDLAIDLDRDPPVHLSVACGSLVLASVKVEEHIATLPMTVSLDGIEDQLAHVTVRLLDAETRAPLEPEAIMLSPGFRQTRGTNLVQGDGAGGFSLTGVLPATRPFLIALPGYEPISGSVDISAPHVDLGTMMLSRPREIAGRLLDENDQPVTAHLRSRDLDREARSPPVRLHVMLEQSGGGRFHATVGASHYLLTIDDPHFAAEAWLVDTTGGNVTGLDLRVHRGTPVTLVAPNDADVGYEIEIRDALKLPIATQLVRCAERLHVRLAAGTYLVALRTTRGREWTTSLAIGNDPAQLVLPASR